MLVEPFEGESRLCSYYPYVILKNLEIITRPSFSFPFVKPPNMIPNSDETILWTEYGPDNEQNIIPTP